MWLLDDAKVHQDKEVYAWALERRFSIDRHIHLGPQILWLQTDHVSTGDDRVSIMIFIPRPTAHEPHETGSTAEELTLQEPPFKVVVRSPVGGPIFAESSVQCEVGDSIVLEGGEQLWAGKDEQASPGLPDACMLCVLHQKFPVKVDEGGSY